MSDQSSTTLESMSQAVWYNRWTLGKFKKYLQGQIVEVGCGIGNFSKLLLKYGELTAIDINRKYVSDARKEVNGRAEIGVGDIEKGNYFFKKKVFNTVVCINVLEHLRDDRKALKNIHKLLAKEGMLILLVPAHRFLYNLIDESIHHFRRYEKKGLMNLLKSCEFEIVEKRTLNFLGGIGWFIAGNLFKESEVSGSKIKLFSFISPIFLLMENLIGPPFGTSILVIAKKK